MFRHNLLVTLRNFRKNKSTFFINLIGLSTGLACTILIYLWVQDELSFDKFHKKDAQLYQVMEHQQYADEIMTTWSTPGILAETLAEEIPEIEYAATVTWPSGYTLSIEDHSVKGQGYDVGEDFFNIFSFELVQGDPDLVLNEKMNMVISEDLAIRLFGTTENVIGKQVELQHEELFQVSGVFSDIPANSILRFDFVISFERYKDNNEWVLSWGNNGPKTYIILTEGSDPQFVSDKIAGFVKDRDEESNVTLFLKKYSDQYLYGSWENGQPSGGRIEYVRLFSLIAIFILIIACINFMNLSTARATKRGKEVGLKKSIGAMRGSLIAQYLAESTVTSAISMFIAYLMVWLVLPEFNTMTGKEITLLITPSLAGWSMILILFTGLIAGSYPAFYLSSFSAVRMLKGDMRGSIGELWARKGLVVFQFTLSVILIVSVIVIYRQIQFVQNKNLGYNKENVIYFTIEGELEERLDTFLPELRKIPGVLNASSMAHDLIGRQNNTSGLNWPGKDPEANILFEHVRANYGLIETLGIEMLEGRPFDRDYRTDTSALIVNETAIKIMGLEDDPIGQVVRLWDEYDFHIIGVTKDFHFQSLHTEVNPLFFRLGNFYWNIAVRVESGDVPATLERIEELYSEFNPGFVFDYRFLDNMYAEQYASEQRVASLSQYFAGFAILISCLGLFGLAIFTGERRMKEVGIRKVLGSSVANIVYLLSIDFTRLVFVAILIALPASYLLVSDWLTRFAFRINLNVWYFLSAGFLAIVIAWLTISVQAFKSARVNPTSCLRDE